MKKRIIKAFTLVELLVVIAIVAILSTVAIAGYSSFTVKAYISNDKTKAELINRHLKIYQMDNEINDENDLKIVIDEMYGKDAYEALTPESAEYGYHYWYNTETGVVSLAKTEELNVVTTQNLIREKARTLKFDTKNSFRSSVVPGYLLLDRGGSALANAITKIDSIATAEDYEYIIDNVNKVKKNEYDKKVAVVLENKLTSTAIISNDGTFRYSDVENVTNIYYTHDVTSISATLYEYDGENIIKSYLSNSNNEYVVSASSITLPETITNVESYALYINVGNLDVVPTLNTSLTEDELLNVFKANATNAAITITNDANEFNSYQFNNGVLVNITTGETIGTPSYSNPVKDGDFTIECQEDGNGKVKMIDKLYVSYEQEIFNLDAVFTNNQVSSTEVLWTSSNPELVSIDLEGKATIESLPLVGEDYEVTLRATSIAGEDYEEITVFIVRPVSGNITLGETHTLLVNNTTIDNTIDITYNGEISEFNFTDLYLTYNINDVVSCDSDYTITTSGDLFQVNGNSTNGYSLKLNEYDGTQELTIKVGNYLEKTFIVTVVDNSESPFELVFENTDKYMYRLGNANAVSLSSLFKLSDGKNINNRDVKLSIYDASKTSGDNILSNIAISGEGFTATYDNELTGTNWDESTIKFGGSGVAIIEIGVGTLSTRLAVEVIDGKNVASQNDFTNSTNNVLLNDINNAGHLEFANVTIYGNGFALNAQTFTSTAQISLITLSSANLDNLIINGPVYPEVVFASDASSGYYVVGVQTYGDCTISNSYISGFRSTIKTQNGHLVVDNSTLVGGVYANMEIVGADLITLTNVTTVQSTTKVTVGSDLDKTVLGAGIVFASSATSNTSLEINGYLNQYNWVNESDSSNLPSDFATVFKSVFTDSKYSSFIHTVDGIKYFNAGFVFDGERTNVGTDNRTNKSKVPYSSIIASALLYTGTIYTYDNSLGSVSASNMIFNGYSATTQNIIKPKFNFTNVGIVPEEADETYYYYDGIIHIGIPLNNSYSISALEGVSVKKYNKDYSINVSCTGGTLSNDVITFSSKGNYVLTYSVTDNVFFDLNGNIVNKSIDYKYTIEVEVGITTIPNAVINTNTSNNVIYGRTGYFWDYDYYLCVPLLEGISITDYNEDGAFNVSISATSLPSGMSVSGSGNYMTTGNLSVYNNTLYLCSEKVADNKGNYSITITYSYVGGNGTTVTTIKIFTFTSSTSHKSWWG